MFFNVLRRFLKLAARPKIYASFVGVKFGSNCVIMSKEFGSEPYLISIGDNVEVTTGVKFINHEGALWCVRNLYSKYSGVDIVKPISIGDNVYLGNDVKIMPGVKIFNDTIIGANSLLLTDTNYGPGVFAGSPARFICTIDEFIDKKKPEFEDTKNLNFKEKKQFFLDKYKNESL